MTDSEIIQHLRERDEHVTRNYFYAYCRMAYGIYNQRYQLWDKPEMDFYSIAHEYYLSLSKNDFRQLEDCSPDISLRTWMINGFRFVLLDKLKAVVREHRTESIEERVERSQLSFDVADDNFQKSFRDTVEEACRSAYGRDEKNVLIVRMILIEGFKGKEVAQQLGLTPSAVSQRYQHAMHDVVVPYFKNYFTATPGSGMRAIRMAKSINCDFQSFSMADADFSDNYDMYNDFIPSDMQREPDRNHRITPEYITQLQPDEIFVFGSNLAGMHGGGAARIARLQFGAQMGQGVGLQGQSYAIPTMQGGTETIRPYVDEFVRFARQHPELTFLVTRIGCGIAGFDDADIAPLFREATLVDNIHLPESFWEELGR